MTAPEPSRFHSNLAGLPAATDAPFEREEFEGRIARIRAEMERDGVSCLFLSAPESIYYATGYACEWYQASSPMVWLPASGVAIHVDHDDPIHFEHVQEATLLRLSSVSTDVRLTEAEGVDQQDFVVEELRREGWLNSTMGLEMGSYRPYRLASESFEHRLVESGASVLDSTGIVRRLRRRKSPAEMSCIREAQRIADVGMLAAAEAIGVGVTELEVYGSMVNAMARAGGEVTAIPPPVVSGPRASTVHGLASRRTIQAGEIVNVDLCGVYNRYHANLARSFAVGEPSTAVRQAFDAVYGAVAIAAEVLRPNLPVDELLMRLEEYYATTGLLGHEWWVGGYELGIAFPPDWVGDFVYSLGEEHVGEVLSPGEVVNLETIFYLPQQAGTAFCINTVLVEENRAQFINGTPAQLQVL